MSNQHSVEESVDGGRRGAIVATSLVGGIGGLCTALPFALTFLPSEKAKAAGAPVEVDIADIKEGEVKVVEWRGQPVWVVRRTKEMLDSLAKVEQQVADPKSERNPSDLTPEYCRNPHRSIKPEVLVTVGICSHLGCSPSGPFAPGVNVALPGADWGFVCPCHGSTFDLAGRVYKGKPAPDNLKVPPHMYLSDTRIIIGEDKKGA